MSCDRLKYSVFSGLVPLLVSVLHHHPVTAKPAYGSYFGVSPAVSVTDSSQEEQSLGGAVGVRYKFLKLPISLRTQALIGGNTAIVPTVSYDIPLNWQTDAYVGAGFVLAGGDSLSPVGNQTSFAIQPGIDYVLPNSNTVIFGNAIIAVDGYKGSGGNAISIQGGIGWRF